MKALTFIRPKFLYQVAEEGKNGEKKDIPPPAPRGPAVAAANGEAAHDLQETLSTPVKKTKPTKAEQDEINRTVPASGEEDRRDFRVRRATPVMTNAPQAAPRKIVKIDGTGNPVASTQDSPPTTPEKQEKKREIPRFGAQGRVNNTGNPPATTQASETAQTPGKPRDPDREYRTLYRRDGSAPETVSRRFGGVWTNERGVGIIGQDHNMRPETPAPPSDNPTPTTPSTNSTPEKPDKQRPFKPQTAPEQPPQTPRPAEKENFNKLDFSGTTSPETTHGSTPSENTTTPPAPTTSENKEPPKPTTPEKNQSNRTFEEESADFQTRMERGEYHVDNKFTDAGREHLKRVDALRPAAPGTEEKDEKIPETPAPAETEKAPTPAQPSTETGANKSPLPIKNKPPLPESIEQGNEAVITVNGKSIPLTRESPDAAWRDRDGVPYGDALVAGSMEKNTAEKTQETKTASEPTKPPVPETPIAQLVVSPVATNNTPVPPVNSSDTNPPATLSTPNTPANLSSSPQANKRPRIKIGGFWAGSEEEKEYLKKENSFSDNINNGSFVQKNSTGEQEFTPQGRATFRELIATEHDYLPGALFNESTAGQGLPTNPEDKEKALRDQEKLFFQNRDKHKNLKQVESERTIVTATRHPDAQARPLNGGEQTINYRTDRVEVASPDKNPRTVQDWLDWKPRTHMVPKEIENRKTGKIEKVEVEEIIPDRPSLYLYSAEEDALGNPRFSGRVLHPSQLTGDIANDNLYTANIDINGDGQAEQVWIAPVAKRAKNRAHSLSRGDAAVGPSQPATLIPKKPEKKEEFKPLDLPPITYN